MSAAEAADGGVGMTKKGVVSKREEIDGVKFHGTPMHGEVNGAMLTVLTVAITQGGEVEEGVFLVLGQSEDIKAIVFRLRNRGYFGSAKGVQNPGKSGPMPHDEDVRRCCRSDCFD